MKKYKILFSFGTRPEAIKLIPLYLELKSQDYFQVAISSSGQHDEMLEQVFNVFDIKPDYDLKIMSTCNGLTDITSVLSKSFQGVIDDFKPAAVIVQGDTSTAMVSSLIGFYNRLKIFHIEAGLRTNNRFSPFPEEVNRKIISCYADLHFAPTTHNLANLVNEGIDEGSIFVTGNTVIDSLKIIKDKINSNNILQAELSSKIRDMVGDFSDKYVLITLHRRENFGSSMIDICRGLKKLAQTNTEHSFIFPVHLNPMVREVVFSQLANIPNIHLCEPLSYIDFIFLLIGCQCVITDSGGIQEEAPSLGKPVFVARESTERQEAVKAGTAILVGSDPTKLFTEVNDVLNSKYRYNQIATIKNPYGEGDSSKRIMEIIKTHVSC